MPALPRLLPLRPARVPALRLYRLSPAEPVPEPLQADWEYGVDRLLSCCGDAETVLWEAPRARVLELRYCLAEAADAGAAGRPVSLTMIRTLLDARGRPIAWWQRSMARARAAAILLPASAAPNRSIYCVHAERAPLWETVQRLCSERYAAERAGETAAVARATGGAPLGALAAGA
ncbi:hypothetical protein [Eleftheria terrae]|uniref:hypothetical protein n=1 Tax=Eleftheria terrae TaxID=1597781 RepID=UPI00263B3385|nr:hypothetical protein [Eleftheria terrae]WKB52335.1 hypothetical protein N7L95_21465 [Eleftheria terrae]